MSYVLTSVGQGPDAVCTITCGPRCVADSLLGTYPADWTAGAQEGAGDCQEAQRATEEGEAAVRKVQLEVSPVGASSLTCHFCHLDLVTLHLGYLSPFDVRWNAIWPGPSWQSMV